MACCFDCILQSCGGSGLSAQIGALQQSWRANAPRILLVSSFGQAQSPCASYAHPTAAIAINMRTGGAESVPSSAFPSVVGGPCIHYTALYADIL